MTHLLDTSLEKLQNHCQATVVNALSHVSLNSVNKISSISKSMLQDKRKTSHHKLLDKAQKVQSSCELLRLMTMSQIQYFKYICGVLILKPVDLREITFETYLSDFIAHFQTDIETKSLKVQFKVLNSLDEEPCAKSYLDWGVYESILYHLISNAIKHSR